MTSAFDHLIPKGKMTIVPYVLFFPINWPTYSFYRRAANYWFGKTQGREEARQQMVALRRFRLVIKNGAR